MRVFVSGPYGDHNPPEIIERNVMAADRVSRELMVQEHEVYCPHKMSWGWERDARITRRQYLELDMSFLLHWAEAFVRIPGRSPGADAETAMAKDLGLLELPCPECWRAELIGSG